MKNLKLETATSSSDRPDGDLEPLSQIQERVPTWQRAAGFEKAQVFARELGLTRKVELAHAPALASLAQQDADRL